MKKSIWFLISLAAALYGLDNEFGTTGYGRIQTSFPEGKESVCFKAPGAGSKYRLGNECETWIETALYYDIKLDNGVVIHNQFRPVFSGPNGREIDYLQTDELYSEISNLFDNPVSFWIGRRFYKRYDSHMSDYFFLNMSGDGAGISNLDLGGVSLSYSFLYDRLNPQTVAGDEKVLMQSHDLRFRTPLPRGEATLFLNYMTSEGKTFATGETLAEADGYAIGFLYHDQKISEELFGMKGENITALLYGKGLARGAGAVSPLRQDALIDTMLNATGKIGHSRTWKVINYGAFENDTFGVMSNLVYERKDDSGFTRTDQEWFSFGIRPYWFFHPNSRLLLEAGYDHVHDRINATRYALGKATAALEFALRKGVWERPVLRFYVTGSTWSDSAKGLIGGDYYADQTSGNNAGVQIEYWW